MRILHRLWLLTIIVASTNILAGCSTGGTLTPAESSSVARAAREQLASECLDTWLNTVATQSVIDDGLVPVSDGQSEPEPVVTQNPGGTYHAQTHSGGFTQWAVSNNVPYYDIYNKVMAGNECPYTGKT